MTIITKGDRQLEFEQDRLVRFIKQATDRFPHLNAEEYIQKNIRSIVNKETVKAEQITNNLILTALDYVGVDEGQHPDWTYIASDVYLRSLYKQAAANRSYDASQKYGDFYGLIKTLASLGLYNPRLLSSYSKEEINELGKVIVPERDQLYTYIGLRTLKDRYLTKGRDIDEKVYELPQERHLIISMALMSEEKTSHRLTLVKELYWALSSQYMTVATPTLSNAGKTYGQLSSCFIDTVEDSLEGIYNSNTDIARLSRDGGGIGVYMGFIRSLGSTIKGFAGASSGVVPWIKQLNNTAVSVDQLGNRKGAISVYLDVWHKDIMRFLDLRLNNGDERQRAHDIFLGVCLPDLFMEKVARREDWFVFDPYEVKQKKGWYLQDFYDEQEGSGSFRDKYEELVSDNNISKERIPAINIMKSIMRSQLEAGVPFHFYRDQVNRMQPNKHAGMVYCSNLCTEILQNQTPTVMVKEEVKDGMIVTYKKPGDFVVCNLSSISLKRAVEDNVLERLIPIQVRALDNVIDLNTLPILQAQVTNQKYRAIGLGTFGWHHLLAHKQIMWESDEAVEYADKLYDDIAFLTIKASMELAREKGAYPEFKGSDWETGAYFEQRGYTATSWKLLAEYVKEHGVRNGYMMAVAPNMSTSILGNSTASIDPVFKRVYSEEKKDFKIPVTAPQLSAKNFYFYRNAYEVDQHWSIKQNAARQRHIDQGVSFNIYVENDIKAKELLDLHMTAWREKLKTTYYVRSTSSEIEDCESCSS